MQKIFIFIITLFFSLKVHTQESTASENVTTFEIFSPELNVQKKIWVYLPKDYSTSNKKYPVIYMHDAQNLFDAKTSYVGEWEVDETLNKMNAQIIVIGIEHGNEKRIDELTPYKNEKYGGGNGDNYLEFIVKTLKPKVDSVYRTKSNTKNTAIFGSSLAGLISFYAVLKYPEVFGKAGVFSPSFWFSEEIYTLMEKSETTKAKIFFLAGDKENETMALDLKKMVRLLDRNRCECLKLNKSVIVKDGEHNEKLWRENFEQAVKWLF
ncbi:alpha/beta hydrolase [Flavobacterium tegetincola]|uniref:alpha/beta hydrolase n=1 Tax=Flavobacterium tegetincola TaxID=150172 RepID=UPI0004001666|nr:alpha/beta hydrolase-fold protein [Flavobacterium tegetincola]